jgi:polysaccharide biosynthesis PFTS motif protein
VIIQKITAMSIIDIEMLRRKELNNNSNLYLKSEQVLYLLKYYIEVFFFTLFTLIIYLLVWRRKSKKERFNLLFGISNVQFAQHNGENLINFLREPRFSIQNKHKVLAEQRALKVINVKNSELIKTRDINLYLLSFFDLRERILGISELFKSLILFFRLSRLLPESVVCLKEIIFEIPISRISLESGLVDTVMTTNSAYIKQDPIFHIAMTHDEVRTIMFWYSDNSVPKDTNAPLLLRFDDSIWNDMKIKQHYVWGNSHLEYLKSHTNQLVTAVGSQLFYPKDIISDQIKHYDFLIFDVTPSKNEKPFDFYTTQRLIKFISDIDIVLRSKTNKDLIGAVKSKRKFNRDFHSDSYVKFVKGLTNKSSKYSMIAPNVNLYEIISRSNLVIGVPFTSPVLIAKELGVRCCYFLEDDMVKLPEYYNDIKVIRSKSELEFFIGEVTVI